MSLVGKSNRQSRLDENAALFQVQEEKSEKQKWSEMNTQQRLQYFSDYYLMKCVVFLVLIITAGIIIWTIAKPQKERHLFLAVVHNTMIPEEKETLEQMLANLFVTDPKHQEVRIYDAFPVGYESDAKLSAFLASNEIDIIITNETHFQALAKNDCFADLNQLIPSLCSDSSSLLYRTEGYTEDSDEATAITQSETRAYGINVTNCPAIKKSWYHEEPAILGIVQNCERKENAIAALENLISNASN